MAAHSPKACPQCGRASRDGHICRHCVTRLTQALTNTAALWPELQLEITRQVRHGPTSEIRTTTINPALPWDEPAARTAAHVRDTLAGWCKRLIQQAGMSQPAHSIPAMCEAITDILRHARRQPWADDLWTDLLPLPTMIQNAIDPQPAGQAPVGPCPQTIDGEPCTGRLVARIPPGEPPYVECPRCGTRWDSPRWTRLGVLVQRRQATLDRQADLQATYRHRHTR